MQNEEVRCVDFEILYLSFFVVQVEGKGEQSTRYFKHFQTLNTEMYEESSLKHFLDGELTKIAKRKVERYPKNEQAPTKIGRFIVEPGHELSSNPNYNLFHRLRFSEDIDSFQQGSEQVVSTYVDTSAVRGGVFLVVKAKLRKYFDDPFLFLMKCDFEPKVASIADESSLIRNVEMAITTKGMKSIQYPYMPEEGMLEEAELKIHQASHARYFEDFLKFVEYEKSMPEIMKSQVLNIVQDKIVESIAPEEEEREKLESAIEIWAESPKRELQEHLSTDQVLEATSQIVEHTPEAHLSFKLDEVTIKGFLSQFGDSIHLAKYNGKYVVVIEGETLQFDKSVSPIEFHRPDDFMTVVRQIVDKDKGV
nr:DUF3900 domain-containing protein [Bacillus kexueae]